MIKFFRKIRQHLLSEGKSAVYLKYAVGEIFLVVIGILIALSINNWNEGRKARIHENELLVNIRNAFSADIENQFEFHIQRTETGIKSLGIIFDHIENNRPYSVEINKYFAYLSIAARFTWTPQLTAYKRLESRGIEIIKNDMLLEEILKIYTLAYPQIVLTFDNYKRNVYEYGRPFVRRQFIDEYPEFIPVDYEALLNNVEFRNTIKVLLVNSESTIERLKEYKADVEDVIKHIDEELKYKI